MATSQVKYRVSVTQETKCKKKKLLGNKYKILQVSKIYLSLNFIYECYLVYELKLYENVKYYQQI